MSGSEMPFLVIFNKPGKEGCTIEASVGAGNLKIIMPGKDVPMIIYLKDSPLCGVRLAEGFEEDRAKRICQHEIRCPIKGPDDLQSRCRIRKHCFSIRRLAGVLHHPFYNQILRRDISTHYEEVDVRYVNDKLIGCNESIGK